MNLRSKRDGAVLPRRRDLHGQRSGRSPLEWPRKSGPGAGKRQSGMTPDDRLDGKRRHARHEQVSLYWGRGPMSRPWLTLTLGRGVSLAFFVHLDVVVLPPTALSCPHRNQYGVAANTEACPILRTADTTDATADIQSFRQLCTATWRTTRCRPFPWRPL